MHLLVIVFIDNTHVCCELLEVIGGSPILIEQGAPYQHQDQELLHTYSYLLIGQLRSRLRAIHIDDQTVSEQDEVVC